MAKWYDSTAAHRITRGGYGLALGALLFWPWMCAYWRTGADIAVACIVLGFFLRIAASKRWDELRGPLWTVIGLLALWVAVTAFFAKNDPALLAESQLWWRHKPLTFTLISGIWWLRFPVAFFAISTWLLEAPRSRRWLLISVICMLTVMMADGWTQFITGHAFNGHAMFSGERLTGPLSHPNFGMMLAKIGMAVLGGAAIWASTKRMAGKTIWVSLTLSGIALVLLSGERMPALLLLVSLFAIGAFLAMRQPSWRRVVLPAILALVVLTALLMTLSPYMLLRANLLLEQVGNLPHTEYGQLYRASWLLWMDAPLQGIGLRHFDLLCPTLLQTGQIEKCNAHPHNVYLEWLAESGLGGFLLYIALIVAACQPLMRALRRAEGLALLPAASGLGMAVLCFFPFTATQSNFNGWAAGLTWVGFGIATAYLMGRKKPEQAIISPS